MRRITITCILVVLLACVCLSAGQQLSAPHPQQPKLEPIRITEEDALRIANAYQSLQIALLSVEKKYKIPDGFSYNFGSHQYEPATQQAAGTIPIPEVKPEAKPK
jgi:hypothetical protein